MKIIPKQNTGRRLRIAALTLSGLGVALCAAGGGARADELSKKSDRFVAKQAAAQAKKGFSQVIVQFTGGLTEAQTRQLKTLGADIYRRLDFIQSAAMRLPGRNLGKLADLSFVKRISADLDVQKSDEFTVGHSGADVAFASNSLTGDGVGVCVIDSGAFKVPDLATKMDGASVTRIDAYVNFVPDGRGPVDPVGHGTHVAGIIAGNGQSSTGPGYYRTFYGIARKANLEIVRVLDQTGQAPVSRVLTGIAWAIKNKTLYNIRVMSLSLGHAVGESYTTDPLCRAVEAAWNAGIVVVCAAGNGGRANVLSAAGIADNEGYGTAYGSIQSPANDPSVITVGAMKSLDGTRANDRVGTYSGRGPSRIDLVMKPDIVAPGNKIISTDVGGNYGNVLHTPANMIPFSAYQRTTGTGISHAYLQLSGTSMAAPVVSGAAALMIQADPTLTPDTVKARLMISADKWTQPNGTADPCTFGAGYLNIPAALASQAVATHPALSPALMQDGQGNVLVDTSQIIWGTADGSQVIWGVNGVKDLRVIWGTQVIWGTSTNILSASQIIWGTNVWNDQVIWGATDSSADFTSTATNGD